MLCVLGLVVVVVAHDQIEYQKLDDVTMKDSSNMS